jgi:hypothetical protein
MECCLGLRSIAHPPYIKGLLFSCLPCVAGLCVPGSARVASGIHGCCSAGSCALDARVEIRTDKDSLPGTGHIHPRLLPPSALRWKRSSSLAWSRGDSKYGRRVKPEPHYRSRSLSHKIACKIQYLPLEAFVSIRRPYIGSCTPGVSEAQRTPWLSLFYLFTSRFRDAPQDANAQPADKKS